MILIDTKNDMDTESNVKNKNISRILINILKDFLDLIYSK